MSVKAVQGSPTKANLIPNHSNLLAKQEHLNNDCAITPRPMHGYIEDAKKLLEKRAAEVHWRGATSAWDAISRDPAVNVAFAALLPVLENKVEQTHYAPTTQLLNRISLAVYKLLRQKESRDCAHIFASNRDRAPGGDTGDRRLKPDYITYMGKLSDLEDAVGQADHERDLPWPEIGHIGEDKAPDNKDDGMAQLKTYMRQLKESRPDIPTVHGFKVYQSRITFALLNACDMWTTTAIDCGKLDPWIAYVVMLYSLHGIKDRNPDLRYNAQQLDFVRWDVLGSACRQEYALSPFYVARAPGRNTFASFQIAEGVTSTDVASRAYFVHEVKGFWKLSWQQKSARSREKDMLQSLHSKGWLPGLVRLHENDDVYTEITVSPRTEPAQGGSGASAASTAAPQPIAADSTPAPQSKAADSAPAPQPNASSSDRALEIIHLASIGEPLSQLESPRALIHAFYDLLETLIHMYEEGVLHRDVSWFNVLYKGKHYTSNKKAVQNRPCIAEILHGVRTSQDTQPSTSHSEHEFSPCILVTDLDHAIEKELLEKDANAGREKTGTPMFMAVELSQYSRLTYDAGFIPDLKRAFEETQTLPEAALRIAFPKGDNDFMAKFLKVMKAERERDDPRPIKSKPVHRPRHDAESAFWVFFWAAVRARPRHAVLEPPSNADLDDFRQFCENMLEHVISDNVSDQRSRYLKAREFAGLLHPALQPFVGLFNTMAQYLTVPWHHYEALKMVDSDHAHVAFRRLLLHFELKHEPKNSAMLDLKLNTERPRVIPRKKGEAVERASALRASHLSHVGASGRESPLSGFPETGGSTSSKKRKANDSPTDHGAGSSKKPATKQPAASETARFSALGSDAQCAAAPDYAAVAGASYNDSDHFDKVTAHALRLKFFKDRQLWFSRGE